MKRTEAKFITGVVDENSIMYDGTPHVAFIGRSNVGKSTTINSILERKNLVKVGRTPGKTQEINFFEINKGDSNKIYFVDLPGYGYAKVSKTARIRLEKMIRWYIGHPASDLELVVLIIDSKAGLTSFDKEIVDLMHHHNRNFVLAVNKIDKINQKKLNILKEEIKEFIPKAQTGKNVFYYSAFKKKNIHLLRDFILSDLI